MKKIAKWYEDVPLSKATPEHWIVGIIVIAIVLLLTGCSSYKDCFNDCKHVTNQRFEYIEYYELKLNISCDHIINPEMAKYRYLESILINHTAQDEYCFEKCRCGVGAYEGRYTIS